MQKIFSQNIFFNFQKNFALLMLFISYLVLHFLWPVLSDFQLQLFEDGPWLIVIGEKDSVFLGLQCTEVKVL